MFVKIGIPGKTKKFRQTERIEVRNRVKKKGKRKQKKKFWVQNDYAMVQPRDYQAYYGTSSLCHGHLRTETISAKKLEGIDIWMTYLKDKRVATFRNNWQSCIKKIDEHDNRLLRYKTVLIKSLN